jgi:hypothetical protein
MDIDVVVFTQLAPVWQIQGHALHPYIMVDAAVPWFDPISPIGRQGTQKRLKNDVDDEEAGAMATTDVAIAVNNNAVTAAVEDDEGNHPWR